MLGRQPGDDAELLVAVLVLAQRQGLLGLAAAVAEQPEQLPDDVDADGVAPLADLLGEVRGGQVGPDDAGVDRAAGGVLVDDLLEALDDPGGLLDLFLRPPPGLRTRAGSSSLGKCLRSASPWRMVEGSMPRTRET